MHRVGFVVFPSFQLLDLSGPAAAFQMPGYFHDDPQYSLAVLSEAGGEVPSSCGIAMMSQPFAQPAFDTLIVAGGAGSQAAAASPRLIAFVLAAARESRRIASVCTGAFILAKAGLLNGKRATTHWRQAASLQRRYPQVRVEGDRIFIKDGQIWTAAGISAGIDLALALIEEDLGADAARAAARDLVVYYRRPGGQSQFSTLVELGPPSDRIGQALAYAREHLHEPLPVERLASAACISPRQFGRLFVAETGQTPAKAVERLRAEAARPRVEAGLEPVEQIAQQIGFTDPERMRRAFIRHFGHPPQALRRLARNSGSQTQTS